MSFYEGCNDKNYLQEHFNIDKVIVYNSDEEKETDVTDFDLCSQSNKTLENNSSSKAEKLDKFQKNKILDKKSYLRQNLMVPLAWALSKTLKYNPTNPIHYIACQLLRWKYNNMSPKEKEETTDFVIDATIKRDLKLLEKKLQREEN